MQSGSGGSTGEPGTSGDTGGPGTAGTGGSGTGVAGTGGQAGSVTFTVLAAQHRIVLDNCAVTPALMADVAPGAHSIALTASTMSKGDLDGVRTQDPYVIVNLPLPAGDPQQHMRYFMLNGVGASETFTLPAPGSVRVMFVDSDLGFNSGSGTVMLGPEGITGTVDAMANVLRWNEACAATPSSAVLSPRAHRVTLTAAALVGADGSEENYVLVRLPMEQLATDFRYVILNGVGDSADFVPYESDTIMAWSITQSLGASGSATLTVTDL
jgi:hypothetical protein